MKKIMTILCTGTLLISSGLYGQTQEQQDPPKKAVETPTETTEEAPKEIKAYKAQRLDADKIRTVTPPPRKKEVAPVKQEETE